MAKKFEIRNSTAEFLIFQIDGKESGGQIGYHDETRARRSYITNGKVGSDFFRNFSVEYEKIILCRKLR